MQAWTTNLAPTGNRASRNCESDDVWTLAMGKTFVGPFNLEWLLDQFEWRAREGDCT